MVVDEETEVRRARRSWPVQYKLDILAEIDEAKARAESREQSAPSVGARVCTPL